jgi:DNA-binding Lrp family transcriptional regulator
MDELDERILLVLKKDSRTPFVKIAKQFGLTEGAVRARVKKLTSSKMIERFTIDTRESTRAVVMVATARAIPTLKVSRAIKAMGIDRVYEVSGNYDIVCFVEARNVNELNNIIERIRALDGVADTSTSMVLK